MSKRGQGEIHKKAMISHIKRMRDVSRQLSEACTVAINYSDGVALALKECMDQPQTDVKRNLGALTTTRKLWLQKLAIDIDYLCMTEENRFLWWHCVF